MKNVSYYHRLDVVDGHNQREENQMKMFWKTRALFGPRKQYCYCAFLDYKNLPLPKVNKVKLLVVSCS